MTRLSGGRRSRLVAALLAAVLTITGAVVFGVVSANPVEVTVMTRNLYLGADITRPIRATQGLTGAEALLALGHANADLSGVVTDTNFAVRSRLITLEIARTRPDLIGLQEVALWRSGPLDLDHLGRTDATTVDQDFLAVLLTDLADQGLAYDVVQVQPESDVEGPAFSGDPTSGTVAGARDLRLTMRDVILARRGSAVQVGDHGGGQYDRRFDVSLAGVHYSFLRGYAWAEVTAGGHRFRFVTTHLESQSGALAAAQAQELVAGPANSREPTVVVCDCNAQPPAAAAYRLLTERGRFKDAWLLSSADDPGFTGVLGERLDESNANLDQRLDLVLARPSRLGRITATAAEVTGAGRLDRGETTGLWASDHAGVVVRLQLRGR